MAGDPAGIADSQQRSLTVSDLIGARLAQQAAAAGGELSLSLDDAPREQVSANSGLIASFSSRGPAPYSLALKPDVAAPGVDIVSPIPGGYGTWSGTSMATPAVAGAAALLHQRHPAWTPAQIKSSLVLTARPVFNDTAHKHPTSVLAAGGGMIDVQAADDPGLFAAPAGVSFGLLHPGHAATQTVELGDAGGGGGSWSVSAPGLDAPASIDVAAGAKEALELALHVPPGASVGNRSGNIVLTSGARTVHIRWWGYVERPRLANAHSRHLAPGRWIAGDTREGTKLVQLYRWPAGPAGSGLPRAYPGREQLWSFIVPRGARNAGVEAEGSVVPQILLARDENRLAGEPALPANGNPYLETYGRFERVSGLLVPGPGRYFVVVETRPGHRPGPYRLRLWINDRTPPSITRITEVRRAFRGCAALPRRRQRQRCQHLRLIVRIDGTQEDVAVSASGRVRVHVPGTSSVGRHRLEISASDLQETKNSENASALALPNTRIVHTAFTVVRPASLRRDGSLRVPGQAAVRALRHPRLGRARRVHARGGAGGGGRDRRPRRRQGAGAHRRTRQGRRHQAGGDAREAAERAGEILGLDIRGHVVRTLWIEQRVRHRARVLLLDHVRPRRQAAALHAHDERRRRHRGGRARTTRTRSRACTSTRSPAGIPGSRASCASAPASRRPSASRSMAIIEAAYRAFREADAMLVEINPLIVTPDGEVRALDSKFTVDDNALYRAPRHRRDARRRGGRPAGADGAREGPDLRQARRRGRHPRQRRRAS